MAATALLITVIMYAAGMVTGSTPIQALSVGGAMAAVMVGVIASIFYFSED